MERFKGKICNAFTACASPFCLWKKSGKSTERSCRFFQKPSLLPFLRLLHLCAFWLCDCGWKTAVEKAKKVEQNSIGTKLFHHRSFLLFHKQKSCTWRLKRLSFWNKLCKSERKATTFPQVLKTMWKTYICVWKTQISFLSSLISARNAGFSKSLVSIRR